LDHKNPKRPIKVIDTVTGDNLSPNILILNLIINLNILGDNLSPPSDKLSLTSGTLVTRHRII